MAINILHCSGIKMTWTGEVFWKANQTSHYFKGKNSVLIFSLTSALSLWQILEIILGLKIWIEKPCFRNLLLPSGREANCEKKNGDVAGSCWPKSYCSGVTVIVGLDYWHDFPSSLLPTSSKSPLCPSGVHTDLLRDWLAGRQLCPCVGCASPGWPESSGPIVCVLLFPRMSCHMSSLIVSQQCLFNPF